MEPVGWPAVDYARMLLVLANCGNVRWWRDRQEPNFGRSKVGQRKVTTE